MTCVDIYVEYFRSGGQSSVKVASETVIETETVNEEIEVVASQDETQNINTQNSQSQSGGDVQDSINSIGQILGGMPLGKSLVPNHIQQSQSTNSQNSGSGAQNSNVQVKSYRFYLKLMFKKTLNFLKQ